MRGADVVTMNDARDGAARRRGAIAGERIAAVRRTPICGPNTPRPS
ncbi:MAG: hypothetical protein R2713_09160 [Ilumatobacteraceae bacterium]